MAECSEQQTQSACQTDKERKSHVDFIYKEWTKKTSRKKQIVLVTAGKSGVGKSTLINNFLQLKGDAALEARSGPRSVTKKVIHCDRKINDVPVRIIDMPGLHTAVTRDVIDKREHIVGDLKGTSEEGVDVVFFCLDLSRRLEQVDLENMDTLAKVFDSTIWEHVIIVFTHTDTVVEDGSNPQELVDEFIEDLRTHLVDKQGVSVDIRSVYSFSADALSEHAEINNFDGIIGIPVSKKTTTPENWRVTLLLQVIRKCRKDNIPALLQLNYIDWHAVKNTAAVVAASGVGGAAMGTAIGAGIGALVGGLATAPIGGIGGIPTAAGGAAVGAWVGTAGGAGSAGFTALITRIAFIISARQKIEKRARMKIQEMLEGELKQS